MVVTIQNKVQYDSTKLKRTMDTDYGNWTVGYSWFFHASSSITGAPMFIFNLELNGPTFGLQYDLDNSSIVAYEVAYWNTMTYQMRDEKRLNYQWSPTVVRYEMDSGDPSEIFWKPRDAMGKLPNLQSFFTQSITAYDSINNLYFIALPSVKFPYKNYKDYVTEVLGFNTKKGIVVMRETTT